MAGRRVVLSCVVLLSWVIIAIGDSRFLYLLRYSKSRPAVGTAPPK